MASVGWTISLNHAIFSKYRLIILLFIDMPKKETFLVGQKRKTKVMLQSYSLDDSCST